MLNHNPDNNSAATRHPQTDLWETLAIRACKLNNPTLQRFRLILGRRCALHPMYVTDIHVAEFLIGIMEKFGLFDIRKFLQDMNPTEAWKYGVVWGCTEDHNGGALTHYGKIICLCVSTIKLTRVSEFPGHRSPSRFNRRTTPTQ